MLEEKSLDSHGMKKKLKIGSILSSPEVGAEMTNVREDVDYRYAKQYCFTTLPQAKICRINNELSRLVWVSRICLHTKNRVSQKKI